MVSPTGLALAVGFTAAALLFHYTRGMSWESPTDISDELLEHRAASVPETGFPEPMNRSVGGAGAAGAIAPEETEGELEAEPSEEGEESPAAIPDDEAETFTVEFEKEGQSIEVRENETVLEAGEDEGWDLPYACREGQCLSCGGRITDGPSEEYVVHDGQEMLNDDELDDGYTLTCVAYPTADFTIETREAP